MNKFFILLILSVGLFISCEKETIQPNAKEMVVEDNQTISLFGTWKLVGGKMYVENLSSGELIVYNHFDSEKLVSSLRMSGPIFEFEEITIYQTTWTFVEPIGNSNMGEFWIDGDNIEPYGLNITSSNYTVVEHPNSPQQLGGSARPLRAFIVDYNSNRVNFYVQEAYEKTNEGEADWRIR